MKKAFFTFSLAFLTVVSNLFATPFNKYLTKDEKEQLDSGTVLIKSVSSLKKLSVDKNAQTEQVINAMKKLDPSYIAEIIQIRPYKGNEDLLEKINKTLSDVPQYVGIPYWSERVQKWYELYEAAEITGLLTEGNSTMIAAKLDMAPFGEFDAEIDIEKYDDHYFYSMKNLDKLRYKDRFNAVGKEKMQSVITVFRDGDNWILYAIGGADVARIPFFTDRIQTSFMNRIKSFCNYIFEKI